jgi:hypothetical protein
MHVPLASGENYLHVSIGIQIPGDCFMELLLRGTMDCRFDLTSLHLLVIWEVHPQNRLSVSYVAHGLQLQSFNSTELLMWYCRTAV